MKRMDDDTRKRLSARMTEILGVDEREMAVELVGIRSDKERGVVVIEYLGRNGVATKEYSRDEAIRVAHELLEWSEERGEYE